MNFRPKVTCSVCFGDRLEEIVDLPNFPLTGIYVKERDPNHVGIDQGFNICVDCGHGQMRNAVDPSIVYDNTYAHRGGNSPIATGGNEFFANFLASITQGRKFEKMLDVGCSDLYLLNQVKHHAKERYGIDPVWIGEDTSHVPDLNVIGAFVEDVDLDTALSGPPDLVISAHTFEHIDEPREQLERIFNFAADDALFVIEVPGLDSMLRLARYDQAFHQHINHYSVASMRRLIEELGGTYLTHTYNYTFWGGTMLTAFTKNKSTGTPVRDYVQPSAEYAKARLGAFKRQLSELDAYLDLIKDQKIYGYGGAQMLPTLAYHMDSDLSYLESVLDDNSDRANLTWPDLGVGISVPEEGRDYSDSSVVITALDSTRPILRRCAELKFRQVLVPLQSV